MKRLFAILGLTFLLFGCAATGQVKEFFAGIDEDAAIVISSRILAREIGYEVCNTGDADLDRSLRNVYDLAKSGELSQDAMNQLNEQIGKKFENRPTLLPNIMDLMELVGVKFNSEGQAIGLGEVSPKLFGAVANGYLSGFGMCKFGH